MLKYLLVVCVVIGTVNLTGVNYYETLGVTKHATVQEIKQAYKKLAIKLHPDKNSDASNQERFLRATEAYETLKDPDKRQKYDLYGLYPTYSRKYDHKSQAEYDTLYYNGLYHDDPFVDTISGNNFYNYLEEGYYFINFYSPFCPPCQNVAEHWKKLAEIYKGIIKVGAVNCKYHNSFCYNSMRIGSYPTLLFYPNGKSGNFLYYRGERTLDALDAFVMTYLKSRVNVPVVSQIRGTDIPMAYVLGENRIGSDVLTRIAFRLNGIVTLAIVDDDILRRKLTADEYATVVFQYKSTSVELKITDENELLKEIVNQLPKAEVLDAVTFQKYRSELRTGSGTPLVLYFSTVGSDRLEFHQIRLSMPNMRFGEIECDKWASLCAALHATPGPARAAWGVLKRGGAYQRAAPRSLPLAAAAPRLHSLPAADLAALSHADRGVWLLLVIPHTLSWDDIIEPFTRLSIELQDSDIDFGIISCTAETEAACRRAARGPAVLLQNGTRRAHYEGRADLRALHRFIRTVRDTADMELSVEQVLEILHASSRSHSWLVAHLPAHCGPACDRLAMQWREVHIKLRPLEFVRVGILRCDTDTGGFCANIKTPTARLYPLASAHHFSVSLEQLNDAAYILEWALERIDDSVQKLNWQTFTKAVIAEELNPTSAVKPWLVYFHSPRCYRCYEMYPDVAIAGIMLGSAVRVGRVDCQAERELCQRERVRAFPELRLHAPRARARSLPLGDLPRLLADVRAHLQEYSRSGYGGAKHDEF